jgi:hypothetical protein
VTLTLILIVAVPLPDASAPVTVKTNESSLL